MLQDTRLTFQFSINLEHVVLYSLHLNFEYIRTTMMARYLARMPRYLAMSLKITDPNEWNKSLLLEDHIYQAIINDNPRKIRIRDGDYRDLLYLYSNVFPILELICTFGAARIARQYRTYFTAYCAEPRLLDCFRKAAQFGHVDTIY